MHPPKPTIKCKLSNEFSKKIHSSHFFCLITLHWENILFVFQHLPHKLFHWCIWLSKLQWPNDPECLHRVLDWVNNKHCTFITQVCVFPPVLIVQPTDTMFLPPLRRLGLRFPLFSRSFSIVLTCKFAWHHAFPPSMSVWKAMTLSWPGLECVCPDPHNTHRGLSCLHLLRCQDRNTHSKPYIIS